MSLSARDKKLLLFIGPAVLFAAYWFLALAPKREEAAEVQAEVATLESKRNDLTAQVGNLATAQREFAADYQTVVRLGKAVPTSVDMPSLIVQLQAAASGSHIGFERIKVGDRLVAAVPATPAAPAEGSAATPAAAAGGEPAGTSSGQAAEKAGEAKGTAEADSGAAGATPATGAAPAAGATLAGGAAGTATAPGLDEVPLEFTFRGRFFELADFFHRMKRFVRLTNRTVSVKGRLMTVSGFSFKQTASGGLEAKVFATAYLSPKLEGATAGATPAGPTGSPAAAPAAPSGAPSPAAPAATVVGP